MSQRIFMIITRDMTDKTLVCVFPWEKPLLEEVHGGNATDVTIEELIDLKGAVKVETVKLRHAADGVTHGPNLEQQYIAMCQVNPDEDPVAFPESEYNRLAEKYGMHLKVAVPNVEKVYGSFLNFRRILSQFKGKGQKDINELLGGGSADDEPAEKTIAEMSRNDLMAHLKSHGVTFSRTAKTEELRVMAEEAETATA